MLSNASPTIRSCSCFHCCKFAANCRPRRARCTILMSPHATRSRDCRHCVMLGGRNLRMIPYWSINFLSSSALCTDALSHTSRRRLAGNSSGPVHDVCFLQEQELHRHRALSLNALSRLRQRPVMPATGCLRVRLAFGHSQTQEPLDETSKLVAPQSGQYCTN